MDLQISDEEVATAIQRLAELKNQTPAEAVGEAVKHECEREAAAMTFMEAVKKAQEELDAISQPGGLPADKAFYDELSGEEELTGLP